MICSSFKRQQELFKSESFPKMKYASDWQDDKRPRIPIAGSIGLNGQFL
jgi:hypothetical protein